MPGCQSKKKSFFFSYTKQGRNRGTSANLPPPGWDRVKVSENLDATAVAPVAPVDTMAIRVVEFSNGGYKIRKVFA